MKTKDAMRLNLLGSQHFVTWFVGDLSDADLLVRPVEQANHLAWQIGHFTNSEIGMGKLLGAHPVETPPGFAEQHSKKTAHIDPPVGFLTKDAYLDLFKRVRAATLDALERFPEADLDNPVPPDHSLARITQTLGGVFLLASTHTVLHMGQCSVIRRKLGKPHLF